LKRGESAFGEVLVREARVWLSEEIWPNAVRGELEDRFDFDATGLGDGDFRDWRAGLDFGGVGSGSQVAIGATEADGTVGISGMMDCGEAVDKIPGAETDVGKAAKVFGKCLLEGRVVPVPRIIPVPSLLTAEELGVNCMLTERQLGSCEMLAPSPRFSGTLTGDKSFRINRVNHLASRPFKRE